MPNTAQFVLNRLTEWGIGRVYGYPGDGINGLLGAFHEVGDKLEFIQTRHEAGRVRRSRQLAAGAEIAALGAGLGMSLIRRSRS
jgi:hypothetical protein